MSKRMVAIASQVDTNKVYSIVQAIEILKANSKVKFKESCDVAFRLGVDPKRSEGVRGATVLPHGTGRTVKVAVLAQGAQADAARQAGADYVGFEDLAQEIKQQLDSGKIDFQILIATPDAMRIVAPLGRALGPRGLMPNPKVGTVTMDTATAVKNAKAGQVTFRTDKAGLIHCSIGKIGFEAQALKENLEALMRDLRKAKPSTSKGVYLRKLVVSTTMGPGLVVDLSSLAG